MSTERHLRIGFDSPLGVMFANATQRGLPGRVLVVESVQEQVAKAYGFKPEEVELLSISDEDTDEVLWTFRGKAVQG